jgi:vancomycin resistance protein YoaR
MREFEARPAFRPRRAGQGSLLALGMVLGAVLAVAIASTLLQRAYAGRIYPRVTVDGYALDGRTPAQARAFLAGIEEAQTHAAITLSSKGGSWTVLPAQFDVRYDIAAAVSAAYAVGRQSTWFERLLDEGRTVVQGTRVTMQGTHDPAKLRAYLVALAPQVNVAPVPASVGVRDGQIAILQDPQPGQRLDVTRALVTVGDALDTHPANSLDLPTILVTSAIDHDVAQAAVDSTHNLLAGPVTFAYANAPNPWRLSPDQLARLLTFTPVQERAGWTLRAGIDLGKLTRTMRGVAAAIYKPPHDATYVSAGSYVNVLPDLPGSALDVAGTAQAILGLQDSQASRTIYLPTRPVTARFDAAQARALDFNARMATATVSWATLAEGAGSQLGHDAAHDAAVAAGRLDNLRIEPGLVLTYTATVGPLNAKGSYYPGLNRLGSGDVSGVNGGAMQVASALYSAAYTAGLGIERREAPPYAIDLGGQLGLDALAYGVRRGPDLVIKNTTAHPLLIKATLDAAGQSVIVSLYNNQAALPGVAVETPVVTTHPDGSVDVTYNRTVNGGTAPPDGNTAVTHYAPLEAP